MTALIIVDMQNDFLPKGSLEIKNGDKIISTINNLLKSRFFDCKIASKDWHPQNHVSFASSHSNKKVGDVISCGNLEQILWPDHCIQDSFGAQFSDKIYSNEIKYVIYKGSDKDVDSYSAFYDNDHIRSTGLHTYLKQNEITDIYIAGVATDYCVKYTACDAIYLGYKTYVIIDACKAVNVHQADEAAAIKDMADAGVIIIESAQIPSAMNE